MTYDLEQAIEKAAEDAIAKAIEEQAIPIAAAIRKELEKVDLAKEAAAVVKKLRSEILNREVRKAMEGALMGIAKNVLLPKIEAIANEQLKEMQEAIMAHTS